MKIVEINERKVWDDFLKQSTFLQSWEWGDFQKALGKRIWRLGFEKNGSLLGICLAVEELGRFGKFIYCPRGPVLDWESANQRVLILTNLTEFFKGKGYVFLRLDPALNKKKESIFVGFKNAVNFTQVERSWILDICGKGDEKLMAGMRKNTRYYLKKAMKSSLEVEVSKDSKDFEEFLNLLQDLAVEKKFSSFPNKYLMTQFETMGSVMKFFCVKKNGRVLAGGWFAFFGKESSYLHGASSKDVGDTQAPYLIQWEAIKHARDIGMERHNFWGIVKEEDYKPSYPGFGYSNFKKGFGGYVEEYVRTKDFVYNVVKYQPMRLNEWYRKVRYKGN